MDVELREHSEGFLIEAHKRGLELTQRKGMEYRLQGHGTPAEVSRLIFDAARAGGAQIRSLAIAERTLEEAFLEAVHG
jgi:hypothetical protein